MFVGHGVMFINDLRPAGDGRTGRPRPRRTGSCMPTRVCRGASIGSGAVILGGVTIGAGACRRRGGRDPGRRRRGRRRGHPGPVHRGRGDESGVT